MAKVSIVIPMYKVENYIKQCIESCIKQTLKDIEIIVVNDGSPDKCLEIANKYAKKDNRIKIIDQKNSGVSVCRNVGIDIATSNWIMFVDGDDWLDKDAAKIMYTKAKKYDCDIIISDFYVNYREKEVKEQFFVYKEEKEIDHYEKLDLVKSCIGRTKISNKNAPTNVGVPWAKLYKKSFLLKNNCTFVSGLKRMQDAIFNLNAFYLADKIVYIRGELYHYRINEISVTKKYSPDFYKTAQSILENIKFFISKYNLENEFELYYDAKKLMLYIETIKLSYVPVENNKKFSEKILELKNMLNDDIFKNCYSFRLNKYLNKKEKIVNFLLCIHQVSIVYLLCKIWIVINKKTVQKNKTK